MVNTLGVNPRPKPLRPSLAQITRKASPIPLTFRISASEEAPRVCKIVFATSRGVVTAAATAPAMPPAMMWDCGEYSFRGFIKRLTCSYTLYWIALKGIVIAKVVGYET